MPAHTNILQDFSKVVSELGSCRRAALEGDLAHPMGWDLQALAGLTCVNFWVIFIEDNGNGWL